MPLYPSYHDGVLTVTLLNSVEKRYTYHLFYINVSSYLHCALDRDVIHVNNIDVITGYSGLHTNKLQVYHVQLFIGDLFERSYAFYACSYNLPVAMICLKQIWRACVIIGWHLCSVCGMEAIHDYVVAHQVVERTSSFYPGYAGEVADAILRYAELAFSLLIKHLIGV